jgi:hypothetical protein
MAGNGLKEGEVEKVHDPRAFGAHVSLVATFAINAVAKENPPGCKNDTPKEKNPNCRGDGGGGDGGGGDGVVITQESEQETESGDVTQSYDISNTGDNSNQSVGTQGVANTGNAQNQIGVFQIGSDADDFEFDDSGSSIEVSPTNTTSSDQEVNQAASASR